MTTANLSSLEGHMLWHAACISLTVLWRSARSLVRARWFTGGKETEPRGASASPGWLCLYCPTYPTNLPLAARGTVGRS